MRISFILGGSLKSSIWWAVLMIFWWMFIQLFGQTCKIWGHSALKYLILLWLLFNRKKARCTWEYPVRVWTLSTNMVTENFSNLSEIFYHRCDLSYINTDVWKHEIICYYYNYFWILYIHSIDKVCIKFCTFIR